MKASKKQWNMQKLLLQFISIFRPRSTLRNNATHAEATSSPTAKNDAGMSSGTDSLPNIIKEELDSEAKSNPMKENFICLILTDECLFPKQLHFRPRHQPLRQRRVVQKMIMGGQGAEYEVPPDVLEFALAQSWAELPVPAPLTANLPSDEHLIAVHIVCLWLDENDQLPATIDGGRQTIFTYYASRDRLDVVKELFRHNNSNLGLADLAIVTVNTPASDGRTCLYWFAVSCNLEGVTFCVMMFGSAFEGWAAAVLAVLSAAAHHRPRLESRDYFQFLRAVLRGMAAALQGSFSECLNAQRPPSDWSRLCPWLSPHLVEPRLLHHACRHCELPYAELLLQAGANPMLLVSAPGGLSRSCYDVCGEFRTADLIEVVRLLCAACQKSGWDCSGGVSHLMSWLQYRQIPFDPQGFHEMLHANHEP